MKRTFAVCLILVSIAFLLAANLGPDCLSQVIGTLTAGLEGTVTDVNGKPLAGVAVNYRNLERGNLEGGLLTADRKISHFVLSRPVPDRGHTERL